MLSTVLNKLSLVPLGGVVLGLMCMHLYGVYWVLYLALFYYFLYKFNEEAIIAWMKTYLIFQEPINIESLPRLEHDQKRFMTYPTVMPNSWYHFVDSDELTKGRVMEVRALNRTFVVWRAEDGTPVCQDAFCVHLGANLAVGGKVKDDCIECPFHHWKFGKDGSVKEIPYNKEPHNCPTHVKQRTYRCMDYCGWVVVYYHVDDQEPPFQPPAYLPKELAEGDWMPHLKWDVGYKRLSCVDWVDQVGDHTHFQTIHDEFLIPWTLLPLPWLFKWLFPIAICHKVTTFMGDDKAWEERVQQTGWGEANKHLVYFNDDAGITWKGKAIESTMARTTEMYIGPGLIVFHIPFTIGIVKVFVSITPVEGGSIMRVRTWVDSRVKYSYVKKWIAWVLSGISASQLLMDVVIMENKIRLKKPCVQPTDGPYNRITAWLRNFVSAGSERNCPGHLEAYKNDW